MMVVNHGLLPNNCRQGIANSGKKKDSIRVSLLDPGQTCPWPHGFKRFSPKTQFEEFPHNAFPRIFFELEITGNPKIIK